MLTPTATTAFKKYLRQTGIVLCDIVNVIMNIDVYLSALNSKIIDVETSNINLVAKSTHSFFFQGALVVYGRFKYVKFATHFRNNEYRSLWKCYQEFLMSINEDILSGLFYGIPIINITSQVETTIIRVNFRITTGKSDRQEGDFALEYFFNSILLHRTSFSICEGSLLGVEDPKVVIVGGSQGFNTRTVRREAARASFEIAPEDLLLAIVMAFARTNDFKTLLGIKSAYHSKTFAQNIRQFDPDKIKHQYDELWERHGGQELGHFYQMEIRDRHSTPSIASGNHRRRKLKKQMHKKSIIVESESKFAEMLKEKM